MFIVITKLTFDAEVKELVSSIHKRSLPIFKQQKGLISIRPLVALDQSHTATILEWESKEAHEQCIANPEWEDVNKSWGELMATGKAQFELNTYSDAED